MTDRDDQTARIEERWREKLADNRELGDSLWNRFNGGADGTQWYYGALADAFSKAMPGRLSERLGQAVSGFAE